jgi:DNA-binding response OmpR family regulator
MRKKILIVEDDPDILNALSIMLERDYDVMAYDSPLKILRDNFTIPDLFILDKRMPEMDGLDVCRFLRANPATSNIPIVVISASPEFGMPALQAGATDFLSKPFDIDDLLALVRKYIF